MALVVEDGTGLPDADSYVSLVDARALADKYGWTLPVDDTEAEIALRNGAVYVDLLESRFTGARLVDDQGLAWPREDAYKCLGGNTIDIASDAIPVEIVKAQVAAAVEYGAGSNPRPNNDGREIQEETVGPITQKYFETGSSSSGFIITASMDAIKPLLCNSNGIYQQRTVRV